MIELALLWVQRFETLGETVHEKVMENYITKVTPQSQHPGVTLP